MISALIGLAFGLLWLLVGAAAVGAAAGKAIAAAGILLFGLAAFRVIRRRGGRANRRFHRLYYIAAVATEIAAIIAAQRWLLTHGQEALLFPVVGIIVGLHFIGLWLASKDRRFAWLTVAMVGLNCAALFLPLWPAGRVELSGFGSAVALLVTASS